jgi:hypothetical protein
LVEITGYIAFAMGISVQSIGLKAELSGHMILTNVGTMKIREAIAPFAPFGHC